MPITSLAFRFAHSASSAARIITTSSLSTALRGARRAAVDDAMRFLGLLAAHGAARAPDTLCVGATERRTPRPAGACAQAAKAIQPREDGQRRGRIQVR